MGKSTFVSINRIAGEHRVVGGARPRVPDADAARIASIVRVLQAAGDMQALLGLDEFLAQGGFPSVADITAGGAFGLGGASGRLSPADIPGAFRYATGGSGYGSSGFTMPNWNDLGGGMDDGLSSFPSGLDLVSEGGELGEGQALLSEAQGLRADIREHEDEHHTRVQEHIGPVDYPRPMPLPSPYPQGPVFAEVEPDPEPEGDPDPVVSEPGDPDAGGSAAAAMALLRAVPALWWSYVHSNEHPASGHGGDPSRDSDAMPATTGRTAGRPAFEIRRGWADEPSWGTNPAAIATAATRWAQVLAMFAHRGDPARVAAASAARLAGPTSGYTAGVTNMARLRAAGVATQFAGAAATGSKLPRR